MDGVRNAPLLPALISLSISITSQYDKGLAEAVPEHSQSQVTATAFARSLDSSSPLSPSQCPLFL